MLTQLRIQNFKGWMDTGTIRMAPLTIFFGTNSSGKSSIGQFLMLLKQTVESQDRKSPLFPGTRNSAVQLGSFTEMVFERRKENRIEFRYQWILPEKLVISDSVHNREYIAEAIDFCATVGADHSDSNAATLDQFEYHLKQSENEVLGIGMKRANGKDVSYTVTSKSYDLTRNPGRVWHPNSVVRFYGFPDEVVAYHQNAGFVQSLNLAHERLFSSMSYLGPLRQKADRLYSWSGTEPESVGMSGEQTVAAILAARKRKISMGLKRRAYPFEQVIASKLQEMNLIEEFQVKAISKGRQEYEVKVRTPGAKDFVDLPDVGFGVSQVLPVLVECFYAPANAIIIMEQPEIHLHPSAQSALADVLLDVIRSREDGDPRNIQLVIETHSEHFLRRLQRRIAEEQITPETVAAYFSNATARPAKLEPLQLDLNQAKVFARRF